MIVNVLSIAGSDPSGGAGIQADLKTFSALGAYGMAAVTALTAQNTKGVTGVFEVPAAFVEQQIVAVFEDVRVDAVKIGMAGAPDAVKAIARALEKYKAKNIVLDPVMVAQSGDRLVADESVRALKDYLFPLATLITPNIPEASALLGCDAEQDMQGSAKALLTLGAPAALLKGGHIDGPICIDVYADGENSVILESGRVKTENTHGTGCTLSSAIAVFMAQGLSGEEAVRKAKSYVTESLKKADMLTVGGGHGPVHHFHGAWES